MKLSIRTLFLVITLLLLSFNTFAHAQIKFDESETVKGVKMGSFKKKGVRHYQGSKVKEFNAPIEKLFSSIMDFQSRCNDEHKDRRKELKKNFKCRNFNKNMVETIVVKDTNFKGNLGKDEVKRFVLKRLMYNRGEFQHNELGQVYRSKNAAGKSVIRLVHRMISDKETKQYIKNVYEKESAFLETKGVFVLTEVEAGKTNLEYVYSSKTDHWLLNKSVVVSEFFENMSEGVNRLFTALGKDTSVTIKTTIKK
jgi:hypothetical protein